MTNKQQTNQQSILNTAYKDYAQKLNMHAYFKVSNHALGEDMVQNTFMKTWVYLAKGGKIDTMKSFLYHILNNLIIDEYRKHKATSLDSLVEDGFEPGVDESDRLFNFLDGGAAIILIDKLPDMYRKVIKMRYVQDLTLKEIATITGKSNNTIAVQLHRGLEKLKILYIENR